MATNLAFAPATGMLRALEAREISAAELFDLHLLRIRRYNPALNAIVTMNEEGARRAAQAADAARARGEHAPLLGLPMTIKDSIEMAGLRSTLGSEQYADYVAPADARTVEKLKAAGAVIMGKTNISPLLGDWQADNPVFGRTENPWMPGRTSGGSTGGGGAALAAGLTPLELGTDIGGSIRVPATYCGVFGHKPSERAIPRSGAFGDPGGILPNDARVLDMPGPLARDAGDLALALSVLAGPDVGEDAAWRLNLPAARHDSLEDFRVAVMPRLEWIPVEGEIQHAIDRLAADLRNAGATVRETLPEAFGDMREYYATYLRLLAVMESLGVPEEKRRRDAEKLRASGDQFPSASADGMVGYATEYIEWHSRRSTYRAVWRDFFREWDVLLAPVDMVTAFPHETRRWSQRRAVVDGREVPYDLHSLYPSIATLCGQPATAFPLGLSSIGLPIGLQAVGPYLEDYTTIRFANLVTERWDGYQAPPGYNQS